MIFQFQRAQILSVTQRGDVEMRLVAVHPLMGVVGTQTVYRFNTHLSALAMRCLEHLAGAVDLFPFRERPTRTSRFRIPEGEADLSFGSSTRSPRRPDAKSEEPTWPTGESADSAQQDDTCDAASDDAPADRVGGEQAS